MINARFSDVLVADKFTVEIVDVILNFGDVTIGSTEMINPRRDDVVYDKLQM